MINDMKYRGSLNVDNIFEYICESLSHKPTVCTVNITGETIEPKFPSKDEEKPNTDPYDDKYADLVVLEERDDGFKVFLYPETSPASSGAVKPKNGDIVEVYWVGFLEDGSIYDSSRNRNRPDSFNLGTYDLIKCGNEAFKLLSEG